jgi:general secretion pathway protein B
MSYILDALKKAEAERNLGTVPNLHAQPFVAAHPTDRSPLWRKPWLWTALVLPVSVAAIAALVVFQPWSTTASPQSPLPAPMATVPASPAASVAVATPAPPPAPPVPAAPIARAVEMPPAAHEPPTANTAPAEKKRPAPATTTSRPATPTEPAKASATPEESPAVPLRELPEDIQRELPKLTTNGYLYSTSKADRTVLINQKLRHEGDHVAPDLLLEKLTPSGMVLNYKGYRYTTPY